MMREELPKRRASMSKTTRRKNNVDTRLGEEIEGGRAKLTRWSVKMTIIESQCCGVKGGLKKLI